MNAEGPLLRSFLFLNCYLRLTNMTSTNALSSFSTVFLMDGVNLQNDLIPYVRDFYGTERRCCTNRVRDSLHESSMIAGKHEQLGPYEIQDHELVGLQ